jgi:O-antigen/teichoic acid export membrane protein
MSAVPGAGGSEAGDAGAATALRHGWVYFVATVINRAAGLLLLPLYAKTLPPVEFGAYALVMVVVDVLAVGLTSWLSNALAIVYFRRPDAAAQRRLVSTAMVTIAVAAGMLVALSYPIGLGTSRMLFGDGSRALTVVFALSGLAFSILNQVALDYFQIRKEPRIYLWASLGKGGLLLAANLVFLLGFGLGVDGIFIANIIAFGAISAVLLRRVLGSTGLAVSAQDLRLLMRTGLPFLPTALLDVAGGFIERTMLNAQLSTAAVGVYAFGVRYAQMLHLFVTNSFQRVWWVRRMEAAGTPGRDAEADLVFRLFLVLLSTAALGLVLLTPELLWLLATPAYRAVTPSVPLLALAFLAQGVRVHTEASLVRGGQAACLPLLSGASLAVGAVATFSFVWAWGLTGAAAAFLARQAFQTAAAEFVCRRRAPDQPRLDGVMLAVLALLLVGFFAFGILAIDDDKLNLGEAAAKVAVALTFLVATFLSPVVGAATTFRLLRGARRTRAFAG